MATGGSSPPRPTSQQTITVISDSEDSSTELRRSVRIKEQSARGRTTTRTSARDRASSRAHTACAGPASIRQPPNTQLPQWREIPRDQRNPAYGWAFPYDFDKSPPAPLRSVDKAWIHPAKVGDHKWRCYLCPPGEYAGDPGWPDVPLSPDMCYASAELLNRHVRAYHYPFIKMFTCPGDDRQGFVSRAGLQDHLLIGTTHHLVLPHAPQRDLLQYGPTHVAVQRYLDANEPTSGFTPVPNPYFRIPRIPVNIGITAQPNDVIQFGMWPFSQRLIRSLATNRRSLLIHIINEWKYQPEATSAVRRHIRSRMASIHPAINFPAEDMMCFTYDALTSARHALDDEHLNRVFAQDLHDRARNLGPRPMTYPLDGRGLTIETPASSTVTTDTGTRPSDVIPGRQVTTQSSSFEDSNPYRVLMSVQGQSIPMMPSSRGHIFRPLRLLNQPHRQLRPPLPL